jgi:hypothetical protein
MDYRKWGLESDTSNIAIRFKNQPEKGSSMNR